MLIIGIAVVVSCSASLAFWIISSRSLNASKKSASPQSDHAFTTPVNSVISGEMFIRTKGGDTVKLTGQEIQFYPEKVISDAFANAKASAASNAPSFDAEIKKWRAFKEDVEKLMNEKIQLTLAIDPELASMIDESTDYLSGLEMAKSAWPHASYVFTFFPEAEHKTRTNSDAKFTIKLPPGKWVAVANASRQIGTKEQEERYYWAVLLNPNQNTLLDNSNLVTSQSEESAFHLDLGYFKLKQLK